MTHSTVDELTNNAELRSILRQEQTWLEQAERTVNEVRRWWDLERRQFDALMKGNVQNKR